MMKDFNEQIKRNFRDYTVTEQQVQAMGDIRLNCLSVAEAIGALCPNGREKSLALTNLEQVMFWADAAIARPVE